MSATSQDDELGRGFYAVIAVIVLGVVLFLVPNLWRNFATTDCSIAGAEVWNIVQALEDYAADHDGEYPASLEALVTPDDEGVVHLDCEGIPLDPWQNEYQYEMFGSCRTKPLVFTLGRDGEPGGDGEDADISSSDS